MIDIHIGKSKDTAAKTRPRFQLSENVHRKVVARIGNQKATFPKLWKLEDYYADASFTTEELPKLIEEIDKTIRDFSGDTAVTGALQTLRGTCEAAFQSGENVYCFAD